MRESAQLVGTSTGLDLGGDEWINAARRRRELAAFIEPAVTEATRLSVRAARLRRQAARLPLCSNGRRKKLTEAARLDAMTLMLDRARAGHRTPKVRTDVGSDEQRRAARLLDDMAAVA